MVVFFFIIEIIVIMVYYLLMVLSLKINRFLSYQTFQNKYIIGTNFHEIYVIVGAVPKGWNQIFQSMGECMMLKMTLLTDSNAIKNNANILINCILNRGIYNSFVSNYISMMTLFMVVLLFVL
jgi:hypothetical protein